MQYLGAIRLAAYTSQRSVDSNGDDSDTVELLGQEHALEGGAGSHGFLKLFWIPFVFLATVITVAKSYDAVHGTMWKSSVASHSIIKLGDNEKPAISGRTLQSVRGVHMWEQVKTNASVKPRHAVVYVFSDSSILFHRMNWSRDDSEQLSAAYAQGRGPCAIAMSAIASKEHLQNAMGEGVMVDAVVVTDYISSSAAAGLEMLGIRIIFTNMTQLYTLEKFDNAYAKGGYKDAHDSYAKMRASILKGALAGLTEYQSIIYLDIDAYLWGKPNTAHPFEGLDDKVEFVTYSGCCVNAPLEIGMFALRPRQDAYEDMLMLLQHGFSSKLGWGKRKLRIGPTAWPDIVCDGSGGADATRAYCQDPNTTKWEFVGAQGDKGLFFTEYSVIRKAYARLDRHKFYSRIPGHNFFGPYKPWMPDVPCKNYSHFKPSSWKEKSLKFLPKVWRLYRAVSRPVLVKAATRSTFAAKCMLLLDEGLHAYDKCVRIPDHSQSY